MNHPTISSTSNHNRRGPKRRRGNATIGKYSPPVCAASGKLRFRDQHQASDALSSAKWKRRYDEFSGVESRRKEARTYQCAHCGGWHLTSIATWIEAPGADLPTSA